MGQIKIKVSSDGKYNFRFIKIRPNRNYLLDPKTYARIWNYILSNILKRGEDKLLYVVLVINDLIYQNRRLYTSILESIEKGDYKVLYEKANKTHTIRENNIDTNYTERIYILSVKPDGLKYLIDELNDMDAIELLFPKNGIEKDEIINIVNNGADDISRYLKYCVYFNGIHIGMNIEIYNGDIENIMKILEEIKMSEDLNVFIRFLK